MGGFSLWVRERFPPAYWITSWIFFALVWSLPGMGGTRAVLAALGFLATTAFFLGLRILDEHKDWERDLVLNPQRVLSRGLVTLATLRIAGFAALALCLTWSILASLAHENWVPMIAALPLGGWVLLMTKEFFAPAWLERRRLLYAFSHLLVSIPLVVWLQACLTGAVVFSAELGWLLFLTWISGWGAEFARKFRAPDSYTRLLGAVTEFALWSVAMLSASVATFALIRGFGATTMMATLTVFGPLGLATAAGIAQLRNPAPARLKAWEGATLLTLLLNYLQYLVYRWVG